MTSVHEIADIISSRITKHDTGVLEPPALVHRLAVFAVYTVPQEYCLKSCNLPHRS